MKRWMILVFIVTMVLGLVGCSRQSSGNYLLDKDGNVISEQSNILEIESKNEDEGMPNWGISLSVKNVTSTGVTLVCTQSGGEPTGELQTGSDYKLIVLENEVWKEVPTIMENFGWNTIAYMVPMEDSIEFEIDWEWLYGELPTGTYRIKKGFMDIRKAGDYDTATYFTEFEIEE